MSNERLIEAAFPLRQASLDSVHEKNVRHGHISTLHIWPARRPLAAARACLVAALLPDPDSDEERRELVTALGGRLVETEGQGKLETDGGILRWGREQGPELEAFREKIRHAHGGRPPRVLDPFSGGGAIPLEAMRLGCEAIAADLNPVAWFLLKCTLEYPQRLAGRTLPLPSFVEDDPAIRKLFEQARGQQSSPRSSRKANQQAQRDLLAAESTEQADLVGQVKAWSFWVFERAKKELQRFYPRYLELRPLDGPPVEVECVPADVDAEDLARRRNELLGREWECDAQAPRWLALPSMAYLWARTVPCKRCNAELPLLKTRWLSKKDNTRALLELQVVDDPATPGRRRVVFGVQLHVPQPSGSRGERTAKDRELGRGTMSRAGALCPCCGAPMTMEDIRLRGREGLLGQCMTTVVAAGPRGKEFRAPRAEELEAARTAEKAVTAIFAEIPFGLPTEPIAGAEALGMRVPLYGLDQWNKLFLPRQLAALGIFVQAIRAAGQRMPEFGVPGEWAEAIYAYLCVRFDRLLDRCSSICVPDPSPTQSGIMHTFARFALPMTWDFIEGNTLVQGSGGWLGDTDWVGLVAEHATKIHGAEPPGVLRRSAVEAMSLEAGTLDAVVTDPPYYDAIPYSDLMDFFYVWLRRLLHSSPVEIGSHFTAPLSPKWDAEALDGELVEDASRFGNDRQAARLAYEDGMYRSFQAIWKALRPEGRLVVVFANKQPEAWDALVSALIRAGFQVTGSWPIQTERQARTRSLASAALASSVWLVCRKRPLSARPGFDTTVLEQMRQNIRTKLRRFWDDGIRGPDFVWAATGPALEAFSRHPLVKKADRPGELLSVGEFLHQARRMVVEFVVGRVLASQGGSDQAQSLDNVTTYYLLHRQAFQLEEVPVGPCILYAISCELGDRELAEAWDLLQLGGKAGPASAGDEEPEDEEGAGEDGEGEQTAGGAKVRLKTFHQRKRKGLGETAPGGRPVPAIDKLHRCLQLWAKGEVADLERYVHAQGLRQDALFHQVLQAVLELSEAGSTERGLLEALSNHLGLDRRNPQLDLPEGATP